MLIKKILADNYSSALCQVRKELGESALILETRAVSKSNGPPGKTGGVEITAAVERSEISSSSNSAPGFDEGPAIGTIDWEPEYRDKDFKSLVMSLLKQSDKARCMGLREYQLPQFKKLVDNGVNEILAVKILEKLNALKNRPELKDQAKDICLESFMRRFLVCKGAIQLGGGTPKVVTFVGPTGVGKTTTIAKLAAHFAYSESKKVAIFSLDTYRMGAVEQLRLYGEIMDVPVVVCADRTEFKRALKAHSDKDVIFVDTTGKSHRDRIYTAQLKYTLKETESMETHLVLSAASQEKSCTESFRQFSPLGLDRVLFTKLDEGMSFGSMFNFLVKSRIPLSYFTTGQRVPEDIEVARQGRVISLILNGNETRV